MLSTKKAPATTKKTTAATKKKTTTEDEIGNITKKKVTFDARFPKPFLTK